MDEKIQKKLNLEIYFAVGQFILSLVFWIAGFMLLVYIIRYLDANSVNGKVPDDFKINTSDIEHFTLCRVLLIISGLGGFILWVLGIIVAIQVNSITKNSILLIIFAVIPLWFVFLIVVIITKIKYKKQVTEAVELP